MENLNMETVKLIVTIVFLVVAAALAVIVLMQEGKTQGLSSSIGGSIGGGSETYWSKNKGRSKEGIIVKITIVLGVLFMALGLLLSSKLFS